MIGKCIANACIYCQARKRLQESSYFALYQGLEALVENMKKIKLKGITQSGDTNLKANSIEKEHDITPEESEDLVSRYLEAIRPIAVGEFDACQPHAYNSSYTLLAEESEGLSMQGMKRLGRELKDLQVSTCVQKCSILLESLFRMPQMPHL